MQDGLLALNKKIKSSASLVSFYFQDFLDEIHKVKLGDDNKLTELINRDSLPPAFPTGSHYEAQNNDDVKPIKPVQSGKSIFGNTQTFTKTTVCHLLYVFLD